MDGRGCSRFTLDERGCWIETERFLEDGARIGEMLKIFGARRPSLEHPVHFLMKPYLRVGVRREQIPGPGEGIGGSGVAGGKERQYFVPQLLFSQSLTRLVIS